MSFLTSMFETISPLLPDTVTAWGARQYFNGRYYSLGHMTTLQIDSTNKKASLALELRGETEPLHVTIDRYELTTAGGQTFIEIKKFSTSREWINVVAAAFLKGRKFEVPELVKAVL
jgi:hypothetical protein